MSKVRRFLNEVRRGHRALELVRSEDFSPSELGADELVEIEPGVYGRPPPQSRFDRTLAGLERIANIGERVDEVMRGRHYYGAAAKRRRR